MPSPLRHLPNVITVLRMFAAVPLAWAIAAGEYRAALLWAIAAGASDALDGLLAKRFDWQSELGGRIDPIADKVLLLSATVALVIAGELPLWWLGLSVGRDVIIVGGALAYHTLIGPLRARPTLLSKVTTALQIALVLVAIVAADPGAGNRQEVLATYVLWLAATATLASGVHYVLVWSSRARREWSHRTDP